MGENFLTKKKEEKEKKRKENTWSEATEKQCWMWKSKVVTKRGKVRNKFPVIIISQ